MTRSSSSRAAAAAATAAAAIAAPTNAAAAPAARTRRPVSPPPSQPLRLTLRNVTLDGRPLAEWTDADELLLTMSHFTDWSPPASSSSRSRKQPMSALLNACLAFLTQLNMSRPPNTDGFHCFYSPAPSSDGDADASVAAIGTDADVVNDADDDADDAGAASATGDGNPDVFAEDEGASNDCDPRRGRSSAAVAEALERIIPTLVTSIAAQMSGRSKRGRSSTHSARSSKKSRSSSTSSSSSASGRSDSDDSDSSTESRVFNIGQRESRQGKDLFFRTYLNMVREFLVDLDTFLMSKSATKFPDTATLASRIADIHAVANIHAPQFSKGWRNVNEVVEEYERTASTRHLIKMLRKSLSTRRERRHPGQGLPDKVWRWLDRDHKRHRLRAGTTSTPLLASAALGTSAAPAIAIPATRLRGRSTRPAGGGRRSSTSQGQRRAPLPNLPVAERCTHCLHSTSKHSADECRSTCHAKGSGTCNKPQCK
ncbi:hypothetical protein DFJ73DRAFT_834254 [Zopfochytrium polystomum]|nr:hypothetical protein DFJ73DRAFT_834254 [Zopfochytrium polystomum]